MMTIDSISKQCFIDKNCHVRIVFLCIQNRFSSFFQNNFSTQNRCQFFTSIIVYRKSDRSKDLKRKSNAIVIQHPIIIHPFMMCLNMIQITYSRKNNNILPTIKTRISTLRTIFPEGIIRTVVSVLELM